MHSQLNPYISFKDTTRQAMTFYQSVFGGELEFHTFDEYGAAEDPADADKIMHSMLTTPSGFVLLAADTPTAMGEPPQLSNISLSLNGSNDEELRGYWDKLSADGKVAMVLAPQMWGDVFGMCVDQFGIAWMVNISDDGKGALAV
jgi:PhnB protein